MATKIEQPSAQWFTGHVAVEATVDGRTTTATFANEERAAWFEERVKHAGGTSKRVPVNHPMLKAQ